MTELDVKNPRPFAIKSRTWWLKPISMLCHNWALVEPTPGGSVIVYFFHDLGNAAHPRDRLRGRFKMSAIIDSLEFATEAQANRALQCNSFMLLAKNRGPWIGMQPRRPFFDNRHPELGIYSKEGYWDSSEIQDWRRA